MNVTLSKTDEAIAGESNEIRTGNALLEDMAIAPDATEETLFPEEANRRIYRRSVAYFLFGFGCNRHSIVTDEPSG